MWRKCGSVCLAISFTIYGCGGSAPNPILSYKPGDEKRSCTSLKAEIASNEAEMVRIIGRESSTTAKNWVLGVTGVFFIVPLFFMDLKGKEAAELEAIRHRNRNLRQFSADKEDCIVPKSKVKFEDKPEEDKKTKKDK